MSASSLFESYDTQMIDFPHDLDVPMNPSSSELFPDASMDHDPGEGSIEVDMEEYGEDHSEYEMADGTEIFVTSESPDVEVFDVSRAHSPLPAFEPPSLHLAADVSIGSDLYHSVARDVSKQSSDSTTPAADEHSGDVPPEHGPYHAPRLEPFPPQGTSLVSQPNPIGVTASDVPGEFYPLDGSQNPSHDGTLNVDSDRGEGLHSESSSDIAPQHGCDVPQISEKPDHGYGVLPTAASVPSSEGHHTPVHSEVVVEGNCNETSGQEDGHDPPGTDFPFEQTALASRPLVNVSEDVETSHLAAEKQAGEVDDTLRISEGVYIDPPPAVLLSVGSSAEALFCLFNLPVAEVKSESPPHEGRDSTVGGYHLLLENSPTLYYEPISNVFDALRQDEEFLSYIPHSFEGELVLDAYDLQLPISEDNIHAREFSLHDLNVLHDGSDFAGPLRLRLTATISRFIFRYYALQEQIQRLDSAVEGTGDKQRDDQEDTRASDKQQGHDTQNHKEVTTLPADSTGEATAQPTVAIEGTDGQQEGPLSSEEAAEHAIPQSAEDADYHAVPTSEAQVLEEEDDYQSTNREVGDTTAEGVLDADQIHGSADTDQATTFPGNVRFGGEQTNYQEYFLPEEYDEREGEDLDEAEGDLQFDDSIQYHTGEDPVDSSAVSASIYEVRTTTGDSDLKEAVSQAYRRSSPSESSPEEPSNLEEPQILPSATDDNFPTEAEENRGDDEASHHSENDFQGESTTPSRSQSTPAEQGPQPDIYFDEHYHRTGDSVGQLFEGNSGQVGIQDDEDEWGWDDADGEDDNEYWPEHDAASDNSTATLSSKASCKRVYDEVAEDLGQAPLGTPESKRARVE